MKNLFFSLQFTPMNTVLSLKNLSKTYSNGMRALNSLNLSLEEWDFFALLWPNGAGKSTTIGIIAWLVNKTHGEVIIDWKSIDDVDGTSARRNIGIVPQEFNFAIFEKVFDIVVSQAWYYGISRKEAIPNAEKYLKALWLWEKRYEPARSLSGGMKRRLMIARGLIHDPKILILDEPTAWVDIELRLDMWKFLTQINQQWTTIILTTHYLEEAEALCRNMAIIDHGEIIVQGPIKELLASMEHEVMSIDLDTAYDDMHSWELSQYNPQRNDTWVDISVSYKHSLDDAIRILQWQWYKIRSMRPKSGRLEEFFLRKTKKIS